MHTTEIVATFIFRSDGSELFAEVYDKEASYQNLMSQFLAGVNMFSQQITGESLDGMSFGTQYYVFAEIISNIIFVAITKQNQRPDTFLMVVSRRFIKRFQLELDSWKGETTVFSQFSTILREITQTESAESIEFSPRKPLDSMVLLEYTDEARPLIKELMQNGEISLEKAILLVDNQENLEGIIESLSKDGYIGKMRKDNTITYFRK